MPLNNRRKCPVPPFVAILVASLVLVGIGLSLYLTSFRGSEHHRTEVIALILLPFTIVVIIVVVFIVMRKMQVCDATWLLEPLLRCRSDHSEYVDPRKEEEEEDEEDPFISGSSSTDSEIAENLQQGIACRRSRSMNDMFQDPWDSDVEIDLWILG